MGPTAIIDAARQAGLTLDVVDGRLVARGPTPPPELVAELRQHSRHIAAELTRQHSAGIECWRCHTPDATFTGADDRIWCSPCAQAVGLDHLRNEHPDQYPPAPPEGVIVDQDGNTWRLRCPCGLHPQHGFQRGHPARPMPATTEEP